MLAEQRGYYLFWGPLSHTCWLQVLLGFRVQGFRVVGLWGMGLEIKLQGSGFRVWGLGFRVDLQVSQMDETPMIPHSP